MSHLSAFTDQEKDETGLMYYDARYHDPELKRFTSVDPVAVNDVMRAVRAGPQTLNPYSYVSNNPLKYNDPTGEWFKEVLTGQQSWSDFRLELGQATNQMTQDNKGWDFAVSNPKTTGAIVGIASVPAVVAAESSGLALGSIKFASTNASWVSARLFEGTVYGYLGVESGLDTGGLINSIGEFSADPTLGNFGDVGISAGQMFIPGLLSEQEEAVIDIYSVTDSVTQHIVGERDEEDKE